MPINQLDDNFRPWNNVEDPTTGATRFPESEKARWEESRNIDEVSRISRIRNIAETHGCGWIDGLFVDYLTAGWLFATYNALSEKNKAKYILYDVGWMVEIMLELEKRGSIKLSIG